MAKGTGWLLTIGAVIVGVVLFSKSAKADEGGVPGPQGPVGPQGPQGTRGTILTSGNDISSAPLDALEGDYFLVIPSGDLYRFQNGAWI